MTAESPCLTKLQSNATLDKATSLQTRKEELKPETWTVSLTTVNDCFVRRKLDSASLKLLNLSLLLGFLGTFVLTITGQPVL